MSESLKDEQQRQCPACRNWVSHLATKCHYCGETLGRPRKEEIRMTVKDLGGESQSQYSVSGNVMDALEAFREENLSEADGLRRQKEEAAQTWFGKRQGSDTPMATHHSGLELEGDHKSLADDILGTSGSMRTPAPKKPRYDSDLIRNVAIGVGVLIALVVGYLFVVPAVQNYIAERNKPVIPEFNNLTRIKIETAAPPMDVLQAAHDAMAAAPTPENEMLLEEARGYLENAVRALLNSDSFDDGKLGQASAIMSQATRIDHSDRINALAAEVNNEVAIHKFILVSVDAAASKAVFKLNNPSAGVDEQQVGVGELLQDRFIVTAVTSTSVRLEDTKRQVHGRQRPLVSRPFRAVGAN